jgi:hypothetical protein
MPRSTWSYQLVSTDGPTLLVETEADVQGLSRWLARLRRIPHPQTTELWRVPKSGQAPQCVLTLGVSVERWALSRDKRQLYYWPKRAQAEEPEQAFVVPIPK